MSEPGFRVIGTERGASIEVHDMQPQEVIEGLRHCLLSVYGRAGREMSGDDLTLANMVLGELHQSIDKTERVRRHLHRARWALWGATALNVGVALWYLVGGMVGAY